MTGPDNVGTAHFVQANEIFEQVIGHLARALAKGADPISCWAAGVLAFLDRWKQDGLDRSAVASIIMLAALRTAQDRAAREVDVTKFRDIGVAEIDQMHASSSESLDMLVASARRGRTMEPSEVMLWHQMATTGAEAHPGGLSTYGLANLQMLCEAVVRLAKLD